MSNVLDFIENALKLNDVTYTFKDIGIILFIAKSIEKVHSSHFSGKLGNFIFTIDNLNRKIGFTVSPDEVEINMFQEVKLNVLCNLVQNPKNIDLLWEILLDPEVINEDVESKLEFVGSEMRAKYNDASQTFNGKLYRLPRPIQEEMPIMNIVLPNSFE